QQAQPAESTHRHELAPGGTAVSPGDRPGKDAPERDLVGEHRDRFGQDQADDPAQDAADRDAGDQEPTQAHAPDAAEDREGPKVAEADEGARLHAVDRAEEDQPG